MSRKGNKKANFEVKRHLKLREPSKKGPEANGDRPRSREGPGAEAQYSYHHSSTAPELVDISLLQADLDAQRGDIDRIDKAGFKVVTSLDEAVTRVEGDLAKMRHTLSELQRDMRGNHDDMSSLKSEIKEVKQQTQDSTPINRLQEQLDAANKAIEEVRRDMRDANSQFRKGIADVKSGIRENKTGIEELRGLVRDHVSTRDHAKEMASIRGEMNQLRKQMGERRSEPADQFQSRELDILTSNIAKIGNRANQVESLQMEFEIFKGRVERMENARQQGRPSLQNGAQEISPYDQYDDDDGTYYGGDTLSSRRKRPSSGLDTSPMPSPNSTKRTAYPPRLADRTDVSEIPGSAGSTTLFGSSPRLTKSGKVDKRAQRGSKKSAIGLRRI